MQWKDIVKFSQLSACRANFKMLAKISSPSNKRLSKPYPKLRAIKRMRHMLRGVYAFLLPHYCPLCRGQSSNYICDECVQSFRLIERPCLKCALPLTSNEAICGECIKHPPSYNKVISAYEYKAPFSSIVSMLKDKGDHFAIEQACKSLSQIIALHYANQGNPQNTCETAHAQNVNTYPELLIPAPMHWRKRFHKGFNHSELLCQTLSKFHGIPQKRVIRKTRDTPTQKILNKSQRAKNLENSFYVNPKYIRNKRVAIVDDVMTTGSTVNALATLCLENGAASVDIWVLARTPRPTKNVC